MLKVKGDRMLSGQFNLYQQQILAAIDNYNDKAKAKPDKASTRVNQFNMLLDGRHVPGSTNIISKNIITDLKPKLVDSLVRHINRGLSGRTNSIFIEKTNTILNQYQRLFSLIDRREKDTIINTIVRDFSETVINQTIDLQVAQSYNFCRANDGVSLDSIVTHMIEYAGEITSGFNLSIIETIMKKVEPEITLRSQRSFSDEYPDGALFSEVEYNLVEKKQYASDKAREIRAFIARQFEVDLQNLDTTNLDHQAFIHLHKQLVMLETIPLLADGCHVNQTDMDLTESMHTVYDPRSGRNMTLIRETHLNNIQHLRLYMDQEVDKFDLRIIVSGTDKPREFSDYRDNESAMRAWKHNLDSIGVGFYEVSAYPDSEIQEICNYLELAYEQGFKASIRIDGHSKGGASALRLGIGIAQKLKDIDKKLGTNNLKGLVSVTSLNGPTLNTEDDVRTYIELQEDEYLTMERIINAGDIVALLGLELPGESYVLASPNNLFNLRDLESKLSWMNIIKDPEKQILQTH